MSKPEPTNQTTSIARASLTGVPWNIALSNTKQAWRRDNPGVRLPGGRKSMSKSIWEQCDIIRNESRHRLTLGQLIKRVKEKIHCSDQTIRTHAKTWMDRLTINEIPLYYLKQPAMQEFSSIMPILWQAYQAYEPQIDSWIKTLPPGTKLKDITLSQCEGLTKLFAQSSQQN